VRGERRRAAVAELGADPGEVDLGLADGRGAVAAVAVEPDVAPLSDRGTRLAGRTAHGGRGIGHVLPRRGRADGEPLIRRSPKGPGVGVGSLHCQVSKNPGCGGRLVHLGLDLADAQVHGQPGFRNFTNYRLRILLAASGTRTH
jgi:hypothetical protein